MLRIGLMSASKATRRIRILANSIGCPVLRPLSLCSDSRVSIGDISIKVKKSVNPELVPIKYFSEDLPQTTLNTLRWIMQKDKLGQDVFLIGPPGPLRRILAMQYLELTNSEMEYLALTRDTTESDLKQRREIHSGSAFYVDQCAVRAAVEGRILVLEGIEKAERNVLPVLNNLLENREMQLEDGRFLMSSSRYDALLKEHTKEELDAWKLVRVSEDFRVIALGLPVPQYQGNPLDPPLRSRFQARDIQLLPYKDLLAALQVKAPRIPQTKLVQLVSFAQTLQSSELSGLGLPDFPMHNLYKIAQILEIEPQHSIQNLVHTLYPHDLILGAEGQKVVQDALQTFQLKDKHSCKERTLDMVVQKQSVDEANKPTATVQLKKSNYMSTISVPSGIKTGQQTNTEGDFVMTPYHSNLLSDMLESHSVHDFCLVGPKGCGKTVIVQQFANMLGYRIEPVVLYQDMTSRDLLQQRITLANGDTSWRPSPLVTAALEGHIAELDGLHRVNPGTLAVLHRVVNDRELQLFDGTRLLSHDCYQALKEKLSLTDEELNAKGSFCIHPSFRIIGLAEPPVIGSSHPQWLNSEILSMFLFHKVSPLSRSEEADVIFSMVPGVPKEPMEKLLLLTDKLRNAKDPTLSSVSSSLSTRQLLRIAHRLASFPTESLDHSINKACLSRFLPKLAAASLEKELEETGIKEENKQEKKEGHLTNSITSEVKDGNLKIGETSIAIHNPKNKTKVPDVLFYDIPQHLSIMEDMLKDFALGEHLLLVGNQGVGKNKIVDRFLHLLNRPREYIQLHRDTTVQSLTLQPTVQDGVIIYEDSPLVRAVKHGHVLVVDEADKAPTHVTCILKSLVESGEMVLGDGRRIIKGDDIQAESDNVIKGHPEFRMIVLANRPGFPFLGNDFFAALGDIFSCHAVNNPDFKSEMAMLRQYGPSVPEDTLVKLVNAFGELRSRADQGLISYPYSTREVVSVVKHLQAFPDEGVASVVRNVFDFDSYHPEVRDVVTEVMHKHGIPVGTSAASINLVKELPLSAPVFLANWQIAEGDPGAGQVVNCPVEERQLKIKGPNVLTTSKKDLEKTVDRSRIFTEQLSHWNLPLHEGSFVNAVATGPGDIRGDWLHVLALNPVTLFSCQTSQHSVLMTDLYELFPRVYLSVLPQIQLASLGQELTGQVLLFDQESNMLMQIDPKKSSVRFLSFQSLAQNTKRKLTRHFSVQQKNKFKMCSDFSHENWVAIYQEGTNKMDIVDVVDGVTQHMVFPFVIGQFHPFSRDLWLLGETGTDRKYLLSKPYPEAPVPCVLYPVTSDTIDDSDESNEWQSISTRGLPSNVLCSALGDDKRSRSNRLLTDKLNYATVAVAQPDQLVIKSPVSLYAFPRGTSIVVKSENNPRKSYQTADTLSFDSVAPVSFPGTGQVIRVVSKTSVPGEARIPEEPQPRDILRRPSIQTTGYLEVVDISRRTVRYIPLPGSSVLPLYARWADEPVAMAPISDDGLVTVDAVGQVRMWETGFRNLENSFGEWRKLIGMDSQEKLQVNYSRDSGLDVSAPKHGKTDPSGAPHVGGNTWAGGTGGRDTAGLGGKGGPYRLDAGHDVHQLSDQEKDDVPDDVKKAAREMARRAFKERLREIKMSEYDAEMYEAFSSRVRRQVQSLRVILDGLQAKSRERVWLRHQTSGELDDTKLIEGLTGECSIYKKRGEDDPELGTPQRLPKRLRFVVDVSGSMYRFNGLDGRLDRMMEAACLVMEALYQYDDKIKYDIYGHSGESPEIIFVNDNSLPKNNRERLDVMKQIHAHAQYCMSGDYTLEATSYAIKGVAAFDADEHFVVVLSDANLERYGISAKDFGKVLTKDLNVNAFAIFIGSLGNQAERLVRALPSGHAFVCMDTKQLPLVLQQIFTSTLLNSK